MRMNLDGWIPVETSNTVVQELPRLSAIERFGRPEVMTSNTKRVPRYGTVDLDVVAKGTAYPEGEPGLGDVLLEASKFGKQFRIAEEDLADIPLDVLNANLRAWANGFARGYDLACLGTTAAGVPDTAVPFNSVYRTLSQADASVGYTANANIVQTAGAPEVGDFSRVLGLVEGGDYNANLVVIAHTSFRGTFRDFRGAEGITEAGQETLYGIPVQYTNGAKTTTAGFNVPANGNPFLLVASADVLVRGVRGAGPEARVIPWQNSDSDESKQLIRARRAFALGHPAGAAILEVTAAA